MKGYLLLMFVLQALTSAGQDGHRLFSFNNNAAYQTDILINSKSIAQRGKQVLNVSSTSNISKISQVIAVGDKDYTFNIRIKSMDNVVDAMGKKLHYNSSTGIEGSTIKNAMDYMINKPVEVKINKYGIIENFTAEQIELAMDTLIAFAGIKPEILKKGSLFSLVADITYTKNLQKGHNWTETFNIGEEKTTTKFWIENINETNTFLKFTSSSIGKLINSNSNGTYLVDNKTGIILEKMVYVVSVGYQVSAGGIVYGVSRSANIVEKTKLLP